MKKGLILLMLAGFLLISTGSIGNIFAQENTKSAMISTEANEQNWFCRRQERQNIYRYGQGRGRGKDNTYRYYQGREMMRGYRRGSNPNCIYFNKN